MSLIIPSHYRNKLLAETTEIAIKTIKDDFQQRLAEALNLRRITAPMVVPRGSGLNDDLDGHQPPVSFAANDADIEAEVVQSLAKWKRVKLASYDIAPGYGLYTDMNALRPGERLDNLHSIYVDQWDWERTINPTDRTVEYLTSTVSSIYAALKGSEELVYKMFPHITPTLPDNIHFIHAQELLDRYPHLTPDRREAQIAREHGAVFIIGIGGNLSDGKPHGMRAPDYDDWSTPTSQGLAGLNGDIVVWNSVLDLPFELSSMGIRVDPEALQRQLHLTGTDDRARLPFHRQLIDGELPPSIGGGIGQSRLCMLLLQKAHIGEVQASIWPDQHRTTLASAGITLL